MKKKEKRHNRIDKQKQFIEETLQPHINLYAKMCEEEISCWWSTFQEYEVYQIVAKQFAMSIIIKDHTFQILCQRIPARFACNKNSLVDDFYNAIEVQLQEVTT